MIRLLVLWFLASMLLGLLWAAAFGSVETEDADEAWPDDRRPA